MVGADPAWSNAIAGVLPSPFLGDLATIVTNDGSQDGAAAWMLCLASDFLRKNDQVHGPIAAFDFAIHDIEAIGDMWPVMHDMAGMIDAAPIVCASLARFMADRLPAIWARPPWNRHPPLTRTLVIADRTHDLIALFSVGLKPNGSKDPFALRRAANHWLIQVVSPITIGRG